jgi:hypothetical protein
MTMPSKTKAATHDAANDEAIKVRAYHLWEADGRPDGNQDHYWYQAAEEMKSNGKANGASKAATPKKAVAPKEAAEKTAAAKPVKAKAAAPAPTKAAAKPRAAVPAK